MKDESTWNSASRTLSLLLRQAVQHPVITTRYIPIDGTVNVVHRHGHRRHCSAAAPWARRQTLHADVVLLVGGIPAPDGASTRATSAILRIVLGAGTASLLAGPVQHLGYLIGEGEAANNEIGNANHETVVERR